MNKVTLIGHLGKDPELRTLENGVEVASFSLATSESYRDKEGNLQTETEWHNLVAWRIFSIYFSVDLSNKMKFSTIISVTYFFTPFLSS